MIIRYGYEITITCAEPTPVVCLLTVHDDRAADIRSPETVTTIPDIATTTYRDLFGNVCRRFVAPAGDFTISGDGTVEDDGLPDPRTGPPRRSRSRNCPTNASPISWAAATARPTG